MNRKRVGLGAVIAGAAAAVVGRRFLRRTDPGSSTEATSGSTESHDEPVAAEASRTVVDLAEGDPDAGAGIVPASDSSPSGAPADVVLGEPEIALDAPAATAAVVDADLGEPEIALAADSEGAPVETDERPTSDPADTADTSDPADTADTSETAGSDEEEPPAGPTDDDGVPAIVIPTMPAAGTRRTAPQQGAAGLGTSRAGRVDLGGGGLAMGSWIRNPGASTVGGATSAGLSAIHLSSPIGPTGGAGSGPTSPPPTEPPTPTTAPAGNQPPPPTGDLPAAPARRRRRGWRIAGGVIGALFIAAFLAASFVHLPYYSQRPGSVYDTIERVQAPGDLVSIPTGEIGFVTVAQTANITPWQWLDAKLDSSVRIQHEDEVRGDQTADELREADIRRMQISKSDAVVVALQKLGYDLIITPLGIEVASVFPCTAADGTLGTGDLIIGVDGADVREGEQLIAALAEIGIGEEVELLIERIDPNNPTQSMATETVTLTLGSADDPCLPDDVRADEPRPFIGIGTLTIYDEEFPIDIDIRTGSVSGPSAGLAFTLAVMDVLSEGELTNGLNIVATGSIDRNGNVGPVGGIHQKTVAAERSGADVFLVPKCCDNFVSRSTGEPLDQPSNYEEALEHADDMLVIGVDTLDEALEAIGELGGDVDQFLATTS